MKSTLVIGGFLASVMLVPAFAQSNPPAKNERPAASTTANEAAQVRGDVWRASKLKGLNVYNEQNEKLGDISELLIDKSGKVEGVVIGVGGFLGMGEHDIKVDMSKLKFVDEPARTSSTATTTSTNTKGTAERPATTTTTERTNDHRWYPHHAVLSAARPKSNLRRCLNSSFNSSVRLQIRETPARAGVFAAVNDYAQ